MTLLLDALPRTGGVAWVRGGRGFVGRGERVRVDLGTGEERFARAAAAAREALEPGAVAFVSLTFDPRSHGSVLTIPEELVTEPAAAARRPVEEDRIRFAGSSMPDLHWLEAVAEAVTRIRDGRLEKVVLARDHAVWSRVPFDPRLLTRRLAERFPSCWTFLVDGLVGATPELLVRRRGRSVESLVLAGSAAPGPEAAEQLLRSKKDRGEHELAVRSVRDVLAGRCAALRVDDEPWLLELDNVQHLATRFTGTLDAPATALDLAAALHPTAAVGGVPTGVAVDTIRELEGMDRGRYGGPVGWVDGDGDGEFGIALRCAELSGARARLFAGAGIVADSLPEAELEETRLKLDAVLSALSPPTPSV